MGKGKSGEVVRKGNKMGVGGREQGGSEDKNRMDRI